MQKTTTFAERIEKVLAAGYTQADLGRMCGKTRSTPNQWLGGTVATAENVYAIADGTGFSPRWLATGRGAERSEWASEQKWLKLVTDYQKAEPHVQNAIDILLDPSLDAKADKPENIPSEK